jgi:hypothetical protein
VGGGSHGTILDFIFSPEAIRKLSVAV